MRFLFRLQKYDTRPITIGGKRYTAIIADTSTKRAIGLMFRESASREFLHALQVRLAGLPCDMDADMEFPIDVLWLDEKGIVIDTKDGPEALQIHFRLPAVLTQGRGKLPDRAQLRGDKERKI